MQRGIAGAVFALAVALGASRAHADVVRPNILFVFDTSSSMMIRHDGCPHYLGSAQGTCSACDPTCCLTQCVDGTSLCQTRDDQNGTSEGQNTRMFRLKQALRDTLTELGTDEANFGLARFPQVETPGTNRGCYRGHYIASEHYTGARPESQLSCSVTVDDTTETTMPPSTWFTNAVAREVIAVPVTRATGTGNNWTAPGAMTDYDPVGANIARIHSWLNNLESSNGTEMTDPEIHSGGSGTPLGQTINYVRYYFDQHVKPLDPRPCRKNVVILLTDGDESCVSGTQAVANATALYNAGIELYVVVQQGEQGVLHDQLAAAGSGGARAQAIRVDFTDPAATKRELINIIASAVPPGEICNGVDDNCNGDVDNRLGQDGPLPGVGDTCLCPGLLQSHIGKGMCRAGAQVCTIAGQFACQGCVLPGVESCNGLDDDCDGLVDEDFPQVGTVCNNGAQGACFRTGTIQCTPQGGTACDAPAVAPGTEVCNGIDDNCNGDIDNRNGMDGDLPGEGDDCGAQLGVCMGGTFSCENGALVCKGMNIAGTPEICNGLDDDCDGTVDNGIQQGDACACAPYDLATLQRGTCQPGKTVCKGRLPLDCEGCVVPRTETCDGFDNNCDGEVDEGDMICPPGRVCLAAKCEILCKQGEFPCPSGFACDETNTPRICRSLKCAAVVCPPGQRCKEETGECFDPCAGVTCPAPRYCVEGNCVDCTQVGCSDGKICKNGVCQERPCAGVTCGAGQYCDETGACVALCNPACGTGQRCVGGACQDNPCLSIACPSASQVCDPMNGECKENACALVGSCPVGQKCVPTTGLCKEDPCEAIDCGDPCFVCTMDADGLGICQQRTECKQKEIVTIIETVGGGCACSIGTASGAEDARRAAGGGPLALLVVALAGALRRRRRRG